MLSLSVNVFVCVHACVCMRACVYVCDKNNFLTTNKRNPTEIFTIISVYIAMAYSNNLSKYGESSCKI